MGGRERLIILSVLLVIILTWAASIITGLINGVITFEEAKGEIYVVTTLLVGLLVKLPPTKEEAKATAEAAQNGVTAVTEDVHVRAEGDVTVEGGDDARRTEGDPAGGGDGPVRGGGVEV